MTVITTLDIKDMTPQEYRAVLDRMGVETRPAGGIYLHLTTTMSFGYRVVELWDRRRASTSSSRNDWPPRPRSSASSGRPRSP